MENQMLINVEQLPIPQSNIWEQVCEQLREKITPDSYNRWFSNTSAELVGEDKVILRVPNPIYQFWIEDNFAAPLRESLTNVLGRPVQVSFEVPSAISASAPKTNTQPSHEGVTVSAKTDPVLEEAERPSDKTKRGGLNPLYTFDNFVVGASNEMAHAAAKAVASAPGKTYNPLFIHGGVGLGKTHLLHAIGNAILEKKPDSRICYITSEQFTNEFINALQTGGLIKFRKRYRSLDVLMIDDIHFLAGKERSQEEFFHTFNSLFDGRKQIVLTSDRPASEIASLEQRLVSRFDWGLSAELVQPDIETRQAILRRKMADMHLDIPDAVLEFLAERIKTNVRRLEGALLRLAAYASLSGRELTPASAENVLKDLLIEESRRAVTIDQIQKRVAEVYDLRQSDMVSRKRPQYIAMPRQVAMYLARKLTKCTLVEIGAAFGNRDHGTVLHAYHTVKERMEKDEKIRQTVQYLEDQLQKGN